TSASMSLVTRGLPSREAATPPMIMPCAEAVRNHSRRFRKQVTKGAKGLVLFFPGMVKLLPALSNENRLFLQGLFPSKRRHPSHETGQLPQFQLEGHFSQFLLFKFVNDVPTLFPRHHLSL